MTIDTSQLTTTRTLTLRAPLSGRLVPIKRVPDPVFSQKMVGDGVAIDPTSQLLLAPCDGQVVMLHPANHALTLATEEGLGGLKNIKRVEAVAETRLRVVVADEKQVNDAALQTAGVDGIMRLPNRILHLIVGPNADQYAAEMAGQLA